MLTQTYAAAERARATAATAATTTTTTMTRARTGTGAGAALVAIARPTALVRYRRAARSTQTLSWRDVLQSFAHDAAEMPIVSRLLGAQMVLGLGYAGLRGMLALRSRGSVRGRRLLVGLTLAAGVAAVWGALSLVARTRAAPAVTAFFTYGHALRQYFRPLRSTARAA